MPRRPEPWRRDRILDAALQLLVDDPAESIQIADVAQAAGVSPATVHYHFGDRQGLVIAAMGRASAEMSEGRASAIQDLPDPVAKMRRLIELGVPDVPTPALVIMYTAIQAMRGHAETARAAAEHIEGQVAIYADVIREGVARGDFRPSAATESIAANFVALEDAHDLYVVVGARKDGSWGRTMMWEYARSALGLQEATMGT
ncbi:hypothetical protein GCM10009798_07880 [Nocardioides panacihumi]|uniref:HTH tetR-type domain-containing protein n=1 Tax=Nocardioides panacihumi TaxID=400774 RepID=A0ABN2QFZ0_9ACTN